MKPEPKAATHPTSDWLKLLKFMSAVDIALSYTAAEARPDELAHQIREFLAYFDILDAKERAELEIALAEALINAVDYGCLELKQSEKAPDLSTPSIYHQKRKTRIADPAWGGRTIQIRIMLDRHKLVFKIMDPGPGIPKRIAKPHEILPYGRGIQMMRELVDRVIIRRNPSVITLIKYRG
ncbi:MAG: ATP-binding protein [Syntrophaceae bacterium]